MKLWACQRADGSFVPSRYFVKPGDEPPKLRSYEKKAGFKWMPAKLVCLTCDGKGHVPDYDKADFIKCPDCLTKSILLGE